MTPDPPTPRPPAAPWWRLVPTWSWAALCGLLLLVGTLGWLLGKPSAKDPAAEGAPETVGTVSQAEVWTCSMHPQVRSPDPSDCPICGMDLIPAPSASAEEAALTPNEVRLGQRAQALAQLRTTAVLPLALHAVPGAKGTLTGRIEAAEDATRTVSAFIGGRIDDLVAKVRGQRLKKGQVIARLYSPEVYAAHRDLLLAQAQVERLEATGAQPFALEAARAQLLATGQKLRLLGLTAAELERMKLANEAWTSVPIHSPFAGTVLERLVEQGQYVQTGQPLYRLAKLDLLWAQLDAYQADLGSVSVGQPVTLRVGSEVVEGKVAFVDPVVDPDTGIAKVRVEIPQGQGVLRPGMVVRAQLGQESEGSEPVHLVIPASAPLITGGQDLVYVEHLRQGEAPIYEAREVELGQKIGQNYPVLSGLKQGERVVTHGAFVLDAELEIRGGRGFMALVHDQGEAIPVSDPLRDKLAAMMRAILGLTEALASDDLAGAKAGAAGAMGALEGVGVEAKRGEQASVLKVWEGAKLPLTAALETMARAETIAQVRESLPLLTQALEPLLLTFGNPLDVPLSLAYCPMSFENRGAHWFQAQGPVRNAYFGSQMLGCGELRQTLSPGQRLAPTTGGLQALGDAAGGDHGRP